MIDKAFGTYLKCKELLDNKNYYPDIVIAHSGWGEAQFIKLVWPNTKLISYMEFYLKNNLLGCILRNSIHLSALELSDVLISPTEYQINTIFEGIDVDFFKPSVNSLQFGKINDCKWNYEVLKKDIKYDSIINIDKTKLKIITFIARDLTPIRGYDVFMNSLPELTLLLPNTKIIIVGNDGHNYIEKPENGKTYKQIFFDKVKDKIKNLDNILFLGSVSKNIIRDILSISHIHIYITKPFCLSWSFMEALSMKTIVIGSDNEPINTIIEDKFNGLLFKDPNNLAKLVKDTFDNYLNLDYIKINARKTIIEKFSNKIAKNVGISRSVST